MPLWLLGPFSVVISAEKGLQAGVERLYCTATKDLMPFRVIDFRD